MKYRIIFCLLLLGLLTTTATGQSALTYAAVDHGNPGVLAAPVQDNTAFSLTMHVTEQKRNKTEESNVHLGMTGDKVAMRMEDTGEGMVRMIFDGADGKTTMITTDKKGETQAVRIKIPKLGNLFAKSVDETTDHLRIERTGERRTIDGYDCELVIVENTKDNTTTRSWITKDIGLNTQEVFGSFSRVMGGPGSKKMALPPGLEDLSEGFPIQSTTVDGKTTYETRFTDIKTGNNIDHSLFKTDGLEIREMGF
ncbi:DUF4412 domain-containing protein [Neolewinella litorea]|uniref:DUF4412 domain-containing protein n=1 Tax=Neolewinella litorea TaxID=2562452 RepID=A0A4S4N6Z4_9BACT|nr:DUF4412 domain-containing protein [Neolewinella litorea]THH34914.1 DUF4412 domain-containing protein [Neolewinella litorea]